MKNPYLLFIPFISLLALAGCTTTSPESGPQPESVVNGDQTGYQNTGDPSAYQGTRDPSAYQSTGIPSQDGANNFPYSSTDNRSGQAVGGPNSSLSGRVVYFNFDSAEIRSESRPIVEGHARYLLNDPAAAVVLEGHADERGTREYNIALGERRGEAVRRLMSAYGVASQQIRVLSYGEERPAELGHDEASYARNRRVEITY